MKEKSSTISLVNSSSLALSEINTQQVVLCLIIEHDMPLLSFQTVHVN